MAAALLVALLVPGAAQAQGIALPSSVRVFLDCSWSCDQQFIRSEITLVDFVRDRSDADVHLLVTVERTGSGGLVYALHFIGRRSFAALTDTLTHTSIGNDTEDVRRRGLTDVIEMGLVRYVSRTSLASAIDLKLVRPDLGDEDVPESIEADPWNYWVFSVGGSGYYSGEEAFDRVRVNGNVSANRTTEAWKIRLSADGSRDKRNFDVESGTVTSTTRSGSVFGQVVRSLGERWSAGGFTYANTSSQNNTSFSISGGPQIEYNIFPYSQSTRREFRVNYGIRLDYRRYDEETIFGLTEERVLLHSVSSRIDTAQPWGSINVGAELSHLLTNFHRSLTDSYRLELNGGMNVRVGGGLGVWIGGSYNLIRDQLFLPLSGATDEEILLGSRRLPTGYNFSVRLGLNYRFGSIFNNVVNPRLDF